MREQRAVVREEADYVVVGAGGAGCIVAARLAESGRHRVVVLEAGGPDSSIWIRIPAGFTRTVYDTKLNWNYVTAAGDHIAGRRIPFPRGRVLGGSSSINGHLYVRGQRHDYDTWAQAGARGWGWDDVLPYFRRSERRVGGDAATRGQDGPLLVEGQRSPPRHLAMGRPLARRGRRPGEHRPRRGQAPEPESRFGGAAIDLPQALIDVGHLEAPGQYPEESRVAAWEPSGQDADVPQQRGCHGMLGLGQ